MLVRVTPEHDSRRAPLRFAVGSETVGELERTGAARSFEASFRPGSPADAVTVCAGRLPTPWPGPYGGRVDFAARLEPGLGVGLTDDGFCPAFAGWTLRVRGREGDTAAKAKVRAFDANSPEIPTAPAVCYDGGEMIACFERLELPVLLVIRVPAGRGAVVGELRIVAHPTD